MTTKFSEYWYEIILNFSQNKTYQIIYLFSSIDKKNHNSYRIQQPISNPEFSPISESVRFVYSIYSARYTVNLNSPIFWIFVVMQHFNEFSKYWCILFHSVPCRGYMEWTNWQQWFPKLVFVFFENSLEYCMTTKISEYWCILFDRYTIN